MNDIKDIIRDILKHKKLDSYEILIKKTNKQSVEINKSKVENLKSSEEIQISIRILKNKRIGFTYLTGHKIFKEELEKIIDNTISSLKFIDDDENYIINDTNESDLEEVINQDIENLTLNKMIELSSIIEESAYNYDKRIKIVKNSGVQKGEFKVSYLNSYGSEKEYRSNFVSASVVAVAEDNNESFMGYESYISRQLDIEPKIIGNNAAQKAIRMFGAKKGTSMDYPVIFENELVCDILGLIVSSFYLENIDKNKSLFFQNKIGDKVANSIFNIIDDGENKFLNGSVLFDDEGIKTTKKYLLKEGYLNNFLTNLYYSNKFKVKPTGNGFKPSFKAQPSILFTNLILEKGKSSLENGIKGLKKGLYLTNLMGLHMANPISGDFSLGAEGIIIDNGELKYPVKEIVLTGNLKDILLNTYEIYNNVKSSGSIYAPSILVEGLNISG